MENAQKRWNKRSKLELLCVEKKMIDIYTTIRAWSEKHWLSYKYFVEIAIQFAVQVEVEVKFYSTTTALWTSGPMHTVTWWGLYEMLFWNYSSTQDIIEKKREHPWDLLLNKNLKCNQLLVMFSLWKSSSLSLNKYFWEISKTSIQAFPVISYSEE